MMKIERNHSIREEIELGSSEAILGFRNTPDEIILSKEIEVPRLKAKWWLRLEEWVTFELEYRQIASRKVGIILQIDDEEIYQSDQYSVEFQITKIKPTSADPQCIKIPIESRYTSVRYEGLKNPVIIYGEPSDDFEFRTVDEKESNYYEFKCKVIFKYSPKARDVHLYRNPLSSHVISPVFKNLSNLLESGKYSDFTVKVGDEQFKVHKCVLSQASSFFETMFDCGLDESKNNFAELKDVDEDIFKYLLDFIYKGSLPDIISEVAFDLFALAHQYQIDPLKECCIGYIVLTEINGENMFELQRFADHYDIEELQERISVFIKHGDKWNNVTL